MNYGKRAHPLAVILILFINSACVKQIEFPKNEFEDRLIVGSLISPNKPIEVYFSRLTDIASDYPIVDLEKFIFELRKNNDIITYSEFNENRFLFIESVNAGDSFHLKLNYQDILVNASTCIPKQARGLTLTQSDSFHYNETLNIDHPILTASFSKVDGFINYYECTALWQGLRKNGEWTDMGNKNMLLVGKNKWKVSEISEYTQFYAVFSDSLFKDSVYFQFIAPGAGSRGNIPHETWKITLIVNSLSPELYLYKKQLYKHRATKNNDLFAGPSVPVQLYSNINNGKGIFAGYSTATAEIIVEIKE
ncbi:MAG: DUF4249 family protein [Bacteroidia bacterium]